MIRTGTILTTFMLAGVSATLANGFRLADQDSFSTGRGHAFTATADNASAVYYNPAGLTQIQGHEIRGGAYGLYYNPTYTTPDGREFENENDLHLLPQVFYAYGPSTLPVAFGLGLYAPYGLSSKWPEDSGFRTLATEGSVATYSISPAVAWRVHTNLSIAAGLNINYSEIELAQGLFWPAQSFDEFRFKGDAWDLGYNVGALWKVHEKVQLGVVFRSPTTYELEGTTDYYNSVDLPLPVGAIPAFPKQSVDAGVDFPFPLNFALGISYRPTPAWNIEFNADYTGWDRVETITVRQEQGFPPLLPQDIPLALNWESSWYYELGATRYFENGWHVSAGYIFNESSVPDRHYNVLVTDIDRHVGSIGVGFKKDKFSLDLAYQIVFGVPRTVSGSIPSPTGQSADGEYDFFSTALHVSAGYRF